MCNIYENVTKAALDAGSDKRLIFKSIAGRSKSKGYYYSYDEDFQISQNTYHKLTTVFVYDLYGNFFKEFSSPKECATYFDDKNTSHLYSAARTHGLYKGYQISSEYVPFMKALKKTNDKKRVAQYDLSGNLIEI